VKASVKYHVIYRHKEKYSISEMCRFFKVSRSGYYDFVNRLDIPAKDLPLAELIRECQLETKQTYGYRRVNIWLERHGIHRNPKTVLRVMRKYNLLSAIRRRKYRNYSQALHKYPNLLNRDFHAERPNQKWVTDISYIHTSQGVLYLSVIRDLYDNSIVSYKTGTTQNVDLVLSTIREAKNLSSQAKICVKW
jgi:transposase InsO family protein